MMSPNEYDVMVEHLANEIVDDVMEKEAARASDKWMAQNVARINEIKGRKGRKSKAEIAELQRLQEGVKKIRAVDPYGYNNQLKGQKRAKEVAIQRAADRYNNSYAGHVDRMTGALNRGLKWVGEHPVKAGLGVAAPLALAGGAAAGIHAYKNRKAKEEEQKEKTAFYYDDALEKMAAAQNVWDMADEYEDSYETMLMKQAAEDAYEEAMAQAEAAENVYDAIEAGAFDSNYDDEDYYDYE